MLGHVTHNNIFPVSFIHSEPIWAATGWVNTRREDQLARLCSSSHHVILSPNNFKANKYCKILSFKNFHASVFLMQKLFSFPVCLCQNQGQLQTLKTKQNKTHPSYLTMEWLSHTLQYLCSCKTGQYTSS